MYITGMLMFSMFMMVSGLMTNMVALFVMRGLSGLGSSFATTSAIGV
jgi:hypothetical protein